MGSVYFYHLTESPLEETLPVLLSKAVDAGWRVELRGKDAQRQDWLDRQLWLGSPEAFLAHGVAGGPHDDLQPILLTLGGGTVQGIDCIVSVDGADITVPEAQAASRAMILFDGGDGAAVQHARGQWKQLADAGCAAQYWAQDNGRWTKKAETKT
ncbi:MAG: DNA polymerase III subunit chi [Rhodobacteraceae bacterium]|nr:DNA polymerase III subunit chi [Paracoccaceae bacterium]